MIIDFEGQQHEFPDDAKPEEISAALAGFKQPSVAKDMAIQAPIGLISGIGHVAAAPYEAAQLGMKALDYGAQKLLPESISQPWLEAGKKVEQAGGIRPSDLTQAIDQSLPQPQTPQGQYTRSFTQAAPSAAIGGALSLPRLVGAGVSGLGAEAAGQAAEGTGYETLARIGGGLATSPATSLLSKGLTPFPATSQKISANTILQGENPPVMATAGQQTGRKNLRIAEEELGGTKVADQASEDFTTAALNRGGFNVPKGTLAMPDVMTKVVNQNSQGYKDWRARNPIIMPDRQTESDIQGTLQSYLDNTSEVTRIPTVQKRAQEILDISKSGQPFTSEKYHTIRSGLGEDASSADYQTAKALFGLQRALDDTAERTVEISNPADSGVLKQLNDQYRKLLVLKDAAKPTGEKAADGIISPARLDAAQDKIYGQDAMVLQGKGPFSDLARAGTSILSPLSNSNTAARHLAHALGSGTPTLIGGFGLGAASHVLGGPDFSVPGAIAGLVAPTIIGKAMMSRPIQGYLSNQLMTGYKPQIAEGQRAATIAALMQGLR